MKNKKSILSFLLSLILLLGCIAPVYADEQAAETTESDNQTETVQETVQETQVSPPEGQAPSGQMVANAPVVKGCSTLDAQVPLRREAVLKTAEAALLYEVNSDTIVYGFNMDMKMSPGSLVKIMTMLVALENIDPSETITVTEADLEAIPEDSNNMGVKLGEEFTYEQLFYGMILFSGNDTAVVVARHVSGSEEEFVKEMNKRAKELGCKETNFTNVHGIHDENQYTTARDLAKIMKRAIEFELFNTVMGAEKFEIDPTNKEPDGRILFTRNYMVSVLSNENYYDYRVTGGKTSSDPSDKRSMVATAEDNGLEYIAVVIGTKPVYDDDGWSIKDFNEFVEMKQMLDIGFDGYVVRQVLFDGQILTQYTVPNGMNSVAVGPDRSVVTVIPQGVALSDLTVTYEKNATGTLTAPVEKGERLDVMQVWYGSVCLGEAVLYAMNSSEVRPSVEENAGGMGQGFSIGLIVFGVLIGAVILFAASLYIVRFVRISMARKRSRRRRNGRRRSR